MARGSGIFKVLHSAITNKDGVMVTEGSVVVPQELTNDAESAKIIFKRLLLLGAIREMSVEEAMTSEEVESSVDRFDELMRAPQFTTGNQTEIKQGEVGIDGDLATGGFTDTNTPANEQAATGGIPTQAQQASMQRPAAPTEVKFSNEVGAVAAADAKRQEELLETQASALAAKVTAEETAKKQPPAADNPDDLDSKAVPELKEIARALNVKNYTSMSKQDLIDSIKVVKK